MSDEKEKRLLDRVKAEQERVAGLDKAKLTTATDLLKEDETPREVYVPALDRKIKVCSLQFGDYPELVKLQQEKDAFKIGVKVLLLTWGRADPSVTEESLAHLSLEKVTAILEALGLKGGAIPLPKPTQT
jgi:hypothetical protein